jgi:hypothetical protein
MTAARAHGTFRGMRAVLHRFLALAAVLTVALLVAARPATAQSVAVLPVADGGIDAQAWSDIVEESAFIVSDHGVFTPVRFYELASWVGEESAARALLCGADADCLGETLYPGGIDFALAVTAARGPGVVNIRYELLRLDDRTRVADETGAMSSPTDYAALPPAVIAALDSAWGQPLVEAPSAPVVSPPVVAPPVVVPEPYVAEPYAPVPAPARGPASGLRIGGITAASLGAGLALGGVFAGFAADDTLQEIQAYPHSGDRVEALQKSGRSQATMSNVLLGLGAAAAITGVTLIVVDARRDDGSDLRVSVGPRSVRAAIRF